ncbi:MAG: porin family protein [Candidatus Kaistia colombiensis]|nr:MAG: porin family protein [Kaistia sp.]
MTVVEEAAVAAPAFNWTGLYAGVHAGYGWGDFSSPLDSANFFLGDLSRNPDGIFGGGQIGYNYQFSNNLVAGFEIDASIADLDGIGELTLTSGSDRATISQGSKIDAFGTVRGRLGYAADRFLPYVTGGLAWARTSYEFGLDQTDFPGIHFSDKQTFTGWTLGAGLEYAVTNNVTAKVEYLYADLGSKDFQLGAGLPAIPGDLTMQTVKFGLNYKF